MPWRRKAMSLSSAVITAVLSLLMLTSCEKDNDFYGYDGLPGRAFLSVIWIDAEPYYLDAGTSAIPRVFEWGRYYRAYPGFYWLYYDGEIFNGYSYSFYAWEMEYEIWETPGEPGGYGYHGRNGTDTYFTLELSPYGPYYYISDRYKSEDGVEVKVEKTDEDVYTITKTSEDFTMKIMYKKAEKKSEWEMSSSKND
jgi:hypothetical protein